MQVRLVPSFLHTNTSSDGPFQHHKPWKGSQFPTGDKLHLKVHVIQLSEYRVVEKSHRRTPEIPGLPGTDRAVVNKAGQGFRNGIRVLTKFPGK